MTRKGYEDGAVAVLVALLALVLFGVAALAVDLSNAFVRKRDVQRQADFGALAGGAELGTEKSGTVPTAVVDAVRDQLNGPADLNLVQDDHDGLTPVTSEDLIDDDPTNGDVTFVTGGLRVTAPEVQVNYGFAQILGLAPKTRVVASATVGLFSPGPSVMPVYAVAGCATGLQTLTDPAGGPTTPSVPELAAPSDTNDATITEISPPQIDVTAESVDGPPLLIDGSKFITQEGTANEKRVSEVGFFPEDGTAPVVVGNTGFSVEETVITVAAVPAAVTNAEGLWYVRLKKATASTEEAKWSSVSGAHPLRVGSAVLECDPGSSDGNFGTLTLPNPAADSEIEEIALNMATKLDFDLSAYPGGLALCKGLGEPYRHAPTDGTNCVDTKTGLPALAATMGLITGVEDAPGRLDRDTTPGCRPYDAKWDTGIKRTKGSGNYSINDDLLTCFLKDDSTPISTLIDFPAGKTSPLDPAIYQSPRFIWMPVLKVEPVHGGSYKYTIVDFRPGFITDQPLEATGYDDTEGSGTDNGLLIESGQVKTLKAVLFDYDALPADDSGGPVTPFLGVGPKILRLID